ncbi:AraC family transcriptional regulator [Fulvitalea axinellae]|uniref:AraC family transcriptional regulator n=1 Tax=Fulvitalea axinellae TaxID=1182444 RepID=A0AAU9D7S4_9BACT|nr:AraC family transcriptional regulator [Fulvitalea axinellae]
MRKPGVEEEYRFRINKAIDFIEENLERPLDIESLAEVANFSKFHFHRIFQGMLGETPFQFLSRVRLQKAAFYLTNRPEMPVTEIAERCGFSDLSVFSRNFGKFFGQPPTAYRQDWPANSKISQTDGKKQQAVFKAKAYFCTSSMTMKWKSDMEQNKGVEVKTLPEMTVAYVRHIGPYKGDHQLFKRLMDKLMAWAIPRKVMENPGFKVLFVYHDDPNVTEEDHLRTSVCVTVPQDTAVGGEIGKMTVPGGEYAVGHFELGAPEEFQQAWQWMYGQWLPKSGYQPDNRSSMEIYPEEGKNGQFVVDICIPVQPL